MPIYNIIMEVNLINLSQRPKWVDFDYVEKDLGISQNTLDQLIQSDYSIRREDGMYDIDKVYQAVFNHPDARASLNQEGDAISYENAINN